jgi:hypothetical protein
MKASIKLLQAVTLLIRNGGVRNLAVTQFALHCPFSPVLPAKCRDCAKRQVTVFFHGLSNYRTIGRFDVYSPSH